MFCSQFVQALWRQCQFGGMGFTGQGYRSQYFAALGFDIAFHVRQRTTHANKIIHQNVFATLLNGPLKFRLTRQPGKSVSPSVSNHIDLHHPRVMRPAHGFTDLYGEYFRYCVDAFTFVSMGTDQGRVVPAQHIDESLVLLLTHRVIHQRCR